MKVHDPEQVSGEKKLKISKISIFGEFLKFKWIIGVEGPVTMHSSNSGARAANEAESHQRRGPANRRRRVHPGGGPPHPGVVKGPPRQKKCEKCGLRTKIIKKKKLSGIFFHHFSWRVGNASGFGMQLCFCVFLERY